MRLSLSLLSLLCIFAAACGTSPQHAGPEVRAVTYDGSDWSAGDFAVQVSPAADGWRVDVASLATAPANTLLLELRFDESLVAQEAEPYCPMSELSLLAAGRPGGVGLGVIMPDGQNIPPGALLSFRLSEGTPVRATSDFEVHSQTYVDDLVGVAGEGYVDLSWSYQLTGDYDQNSEVNIGDLTALAPHLNHSTSDGDHDVADAVVDGDGNGLVTIADLTPIGANLLTGLSMYTVNSATGPNLNGPGPVTVSPFVDIPFAQSMLVDGKRRYSYRVTQQPHLEWAHFYVVGQVNRPDVLSFSNVVHAPQPQPQVFQYSVPSAGPSSIYAGLAQSPSLALLPGNGDVAQEGAPLVAYATVGGELRIAYYRDGSWQYAAPESGAFSLPQLYLAGEDIYVAAYSITDLKVVRLRLDADLNLLETVAVGPLNPLLGGVPSHLAVSYDEASGVTAVAIGVNTGFGYKVHASDSTTSFADGITTEGTGQLAGLDIGIDPSGKQWLFFSAGTLDISTSFILDYTLHQGTNDGAGWDFSEIAYPDSPLQLDLGFKADGSPRVTFMAARDVTYLTLTASLGFDGVVATYTGGSWSYAKHFTSTVQFSLTGIPVPTGITISPLLNIGSWWARDGEVSYTIADGDLAFALPDFTPQSGSLAPSARYAVESGGSFSNSAYFTGLPGISQSWSQRGGVHAVAYLQATALDSNDLLAGNLNTDSALLFWRK